MTEILALMHTLSDERLGFRIETIGDGVNIFLVDRKTSEMLARVNFEYREGLAVVSAWNEDSTMLVSEILHGGNGDVANETKFVYSVPGITPEYRMSRHAIDDRIEIGFGNTCINCDAPVARVIDCVGFCNYCAESIDQYDFVHIDEWVPENRTSEDNSRD